MDANYTINIDNIIDAIEICGKDGRDLGEVMGLSEGQTNRLADMASKIVLDFMDMEEDGEFTWDVEDLLSEVLQTAKREHMNDPEALYYIWMALYGYFSIDDGVVIVEPIFGREKPFAYYYRGKFYFKIEEIPVFEKKRESIVPLYPNNLDSF